MQITCGVYKQMPDEDLVWANPAGSGAGFSRAGAAKGMHDNRAASHDGSCAYAALDSAEIFGGAPARISLPAKKRREVLKWRFRMLDSSRGLGPERTDR